MWPASNLQLVRCPAHQPLRALPEALGICCMCPTPPGPAVGALTSSVVACRDRARCGALGLAANCSSLSTRPTVDTVTCQHITSITGSTRGNAAGSSTRQVCWPLCMERCWPKPGAVAAATQADAGSDRTGAAICWHPHSATRSLTPQLCLYPHTKHAKLPPLPHLLARHVQPQWVCHDVHSSHH